MISTYLRSYIFLESRKLKVRSFSQSAREHNIEDKSTAQPEVLKTAECDGKRKHARSHSLAAIQNNSRFMKLKKSNSTGTIVI